MIFGRKNNPNKNILRLGVTINMQELESWMTSGKPMVAVVPYSKWEFCDKFEYLVFILPVDEGRDWYFHQKTAEYSHSINSIIELDEHFPKGTVIQKFCEGLSPDLEIELWNGYLGLSFCGRSILIAPLNEAINIMNSGKTSSGSIAKSKNNEIKVPISFNDNGEPVEFMAVHERMDGRGAGYSNQLAHVWVDSATGPVVVKSG